MRTAGAECRELFHRHQLGDAFRAVQRGEPTEETGQCQTVPEMGGADAVQFHLVLACLRQRAGIRFLDDCSAGAAQPLNRPVRRRGGIEHNRLAGGAQRIERGAKRLRSCGRDFIAEMDGEFRYLLARIDEPLHPAVRLQHNEGLRQRRTFDIGAANIEQPGNRIRRAQKGRRSTCLFHLAGNLTPLLSRFSPAKLNILGHDRRHRRRRLGMPDFVERVGVAWFELSARARARLAQPAPLIGAVQPRIEAHLHTGGKIALKPRIGRRFGDVMAHIERAIGLVFNLQRVAAIGKQRGFLSQNECEAGRTGEAGEPGKAARAPGDIFTLMLIRKRHHKAIEALAPERRPQISKPLRRCARLADAIIRRRQCLAQRHKLGAQGATRGGHDQAQPFIVVKRTRRRSDPGQQLLDLTQRIRHAGHSQEFS